MSADAALGWAQVLAIVEQACGGDERRVLMVLPDRSFHVREVLGAPADGSGLLGLVVYRDDPDLAQRTEETALVFLRPEHVQRLEILGAGPGDGRTLGFGGGSL